jgi:hypothetical protein
MSAIGPRGRRALVAGTGLMFTGVLAIATVAQSAVAR